MKRSSLWYLLGSVFLLNRRLFLFSFWSATIEDRTQAETKTQCAGAEITSPIDRSVDEKETAVNLSFTFLGRA